MDHAAKQFLGVTGRRLYLNEKTKHEHDRTYKT
jgi:hypothetical protein